MTTVANLFYDVHMGASHDAMRNILADHRKTPLGTNEVAIFVNKSWSAAKILYPTNTILYYRGPLSPETIKALPTRVGAARLSMPKFDGSLAKRFGEVLGKLKRKPMKVVSAG